MIVIAAGVLFLVVWTALVVLVRRRDAASRAVSGPVDCTCGSRATVVPIEALTGEVIDHRCPACWLPRRPLPRPPAGPGGGSGGGWSAPSEVIRSSDPSAVTITGTGTRSDLYIVTTPDPPVRRYHAPGCTGDVTEVRTYGGTVVVQICADCGTLHPVAPEPPSASSTLTP